MSNITINPSADNIRINAESGIVVADASASVTVNNTTQDIVIGPGESAAIVIQQAVSAQGPAFQNLFIGPSAPSSPPAKYAWIQTGLGDLGDGFTVWFEDGL